MANFPASRSIAAHLIARRHRSRGIAAAAASCWQRGSVTANGAAASAANAASAWRQAASASALKQRRQRRGALKKACWQATIMKSGVASRAATEERQREASEERAVAIKSCKTQRRSRRGRPACFGSLRRAAAYLSRLARHQAARQQIGASKRAGQNLISGSREPLNVLAADRQRTGSGYDDAAPAWKMW